MKGKVHAFVLIGCVIVQALHACLGLENGVCTHRKWERKGTLKYLVIAGIHDNNNGRCGAISATNFPLLVALDWMLDIINGKKSNGDSYLPNITLGYDLYDNCDDEDLTVDIMYPGIVGTANDCSPKNDNESQPVYAGVLALTTPESTRAASRLAGSLPVFRSREPAPRLNADLQPNLIQTVTSFEDEANALVELLVRLKWNFVFLVHTDDEYGTMSKDIFLSKAHTNKICIQLTEKLTVKYADTTTIDLSAEKIIKEIFQQIFRGYDKSILVVYLGSAKGAFYLLKNQANQHKPANSRISWLFSHGAVDDLKVSEYAHANQNNGFSVAYNPAAFHEFKTHFVDVLLNVTETSLSGLKEDFLNSVGCDISNNECQSLIHSSYNHPISSFVDSVLTSAGLLYNLHNKTCKGSAGLCFSMKDDLSKSTWYSDLNTLNFRATFTDDYLPVEYQSRNRTLQFTASKHMELSPDLPLEIFKVPRLSSSDLVGEFDGTELRLFSDVNSFPTSACNLPNDCPACREHYDQRYSYLHGDVLLLGLFSIHQYGDTPFKCGSVRHDTNDPITVSAFMESIKTLREESGIAFGGIAVDDCYSALNTSAFLSDLFGKKTVLTDPATGAAINFDNVFIIVGALSSPVSLIVGDLSTAVGIPMISYGASSPELDNEPRYPLFLRTVPSDTRQVKGIVELLQKLNITFVGAIYINDAYGKNGIKALLTEAKALGICIDEPIAISLDMDNATLVNVVNTLYERQTRVIVYFSIDSLALRILDILSKTFNDKEPLVFVASEAWGTNVNLIEGQLGQKAKGSIVFNVETIPQDNIGFKNYLLNLNSSQTQSNIWVPKYFEDTGNCDFITSFDKSRINRDSCDYSFKLNERIVETLYQDQRSVHVIHAVQAAGHGYKEVKGEVRQECGNLPMCSNFRNKANLLKKAVQEVNLHVSHGYISPFDSSGSGNIGFTIFNIQRNANGEISYVNIGSYSKTNELKLTSTPVFYNDLHNEITLREMFGEKIQCSFFRDRCYDFCQFTTESTSLSPKPFTETTPTDNGNESIILVITIVLAVILLIAIVLIVVLLLRRSSQHISGETITKSQSLSSHAFPSNHNIYNEVNDYQGSHPRSQASRITGHGSHSVDNDGPVHYADIRQSQIFSYEPRSELLVSSSSVSPGLMRPSKPKTFVDHTRSLSDSRVLDTSSIFAKSTHRSPVVSGYLKPSNRSEGLENLHALHDNTDMSNLHSIHRNNNPHAYLTDDGAPLDNIVSDSESLNDTSANSKTLNYISAKDLMDHSDEEEAVNEISDDTITYVDMKDSVHAGLPASGPKVGSSSSLVSPSDHEVMAINFPGQDKVTYTTTNNLNVVSQLPIKQRSDGIAKDDNKKTSVPQLQGRARNSGKSSRCSVPDIIPHDATDEFRCAPSDSDEENVFII